MGKKRKYNPISNLLGVMNLKPKKRKTGKNAVEGDQAGLDKENIVLMECYDYEAQLFARQTTEYIHTLHIPTIMKLGK